MNRPDSSPMPEAAAPRPTPFLKWAGGKGQLLAQFEPYWPAEFGRYFEPFLGGGAVFFHLYNTGRLAGKEVVLVDRLEELINCFRVVRDQVEALIAELRRHEPHKLDREYYGRVRAWDREPDYALRGEVERAARLLYLNRTCYNGLYRVNRRGQFNVPFGRYRNPTVCDAPNLRAAARALEGVRLVAGDFEAVLEEAGPGDLVYLDPPYQPLSATANFTAYTAGDFAFDDQRRLARLFRELDARGCQVMLSNSDTESIRALYVGYTQVVLHAARPINSRARGRGPVPELLVLSRAFTRRGRGSG
ncbi:MAG: DNA adenine methylase [Anaerolineae bacterium]|nr:DNA adenine methylase [Anaerolineae bacterium]